MCDRFKILERLSYTLVSNQSSTHYYWRNNRVLGTEGRPKIRSPWWHNTSRIVFRLRWRPELCLWISQVPTALYGTAASLASYCDCYMTDTWCAWSWSWLTIAALPSLPATGNGAGYDASGTASHRDRSLNPFSTTSTSLTCQPPSAESI